MSQNPAHMQLALDEANGNLQLMVATMSSRAQQLRTELYDAQQLNAAIGQNLATAEEQVADLSAQLESARAELEELRAK